MLKKKPKYFWEDFKVGERVEVGSVDVDKDEVIEFATRYDPQSFHIDEEAARQSIYGGLIASGMRIPTVYPPKKMATASPLPPSGTSVLPNAP